MKKSNIIILILGIFFALIVQNVSGLIERFGYFLGVSFSLWLIFNVSTKAFRYAKTKLNEK